jgi:hypothetical protein
MRILLVDAKASGRAIASYEKGRFQRKRPRPYTDYRAAIVAGTRLQRRRLVPPTGFINLP